MDPISLSPGIQGIRVPTGRGESETRTADEDEARLREACRDFEALLLAKLMKTMRDTVPKSDLFGSEDAEAVFREMLDAEIAAAAAARGSTGIADMLYRQLSQAALKDAEPRVDK